MAPFQQITVGPMPYNRISTADELSGSFCLIWKFERISFSANGQPEPKRYRKSTHKSTCFSGSLDLLLKTSARF